jgi:hypothetical protein
MKVLSVTRFAPLFAAAIGMAACSSDSTTAPQAPQSPDLTSLMGEMSLSNMSSAAATVAPAAGALLSATPAMTPAACAYSSSAGAFICPAVTVNGLTYTRSYKLYDAAGHLQSHPDANTAAIETISSVKGTVTVSNSTVASPSTFTVDRTEDMTLSGINTGIHVLNGHAASTLSGTVVTNSNTIYHSTTETEDVSNLVLPKPKSGKHVPESGTITIDATTKFGPNAQQTITSTVHEVITFIGNDRATITVTTGFGTFSCTIDFAQPGQRACSR